MTIANNLSGGMTDVCEVTVQVYEDGVCDPAREGQDYYLPDEPNNYNLCNV